jgi:hypothetical protein
MTRLVSKRPRTPGFPKRAPWRPRHNPKRPLAQVINGEAFSDTTIRDRPPLAGREGALQQAEFSRPADRRAAVFNAELAVHGALVGLHGIERDV